MLIACDDVTLDSSMDEISGNSGLVKFGVHSDSNTNVAIKYLTKQTEDALARFRQENEILFELIEHRNVIIPYSRILSHDGLPCYVMERADESLPDWLDRHPTDEDMPKKIEVLIETCEAIISIQARGYIHRDLHENNILISLEDSHTIPKLMDFGRSYKKHGALEGSDDNAPSWGYYLMPPEVEFGLIKHDDPSHMLGDAYAIGFLIKTVLSYDTSSNFGYLIDMKKRIGKFKKAKNGGSSRDYIENRSLEVRTQDYNEWCEANREWSDKWLKIELASQVQSGIITRLIRQFADINYNNRQSDLNLVMQSLESL